MKYCKLETCLIARLKGFDDQCDGRYDEQTKESFSYHEKIIKSFFHDIDETPGYEFHYSKYLRQSFESKNKNNDFGYYVYAPTLEELQSWLRTVHKINVWIEHGITHKGKFTHDICISEIGMIRGSYDNYNVAMEIALNKALTLLSDI